jgi:N-acetylmuramoyl-L-alanine amidase
MATIVIDPGHGGTKPIGGSDPNHAKGPSGLLEKTITLDIAKRVSALLKKAGHSVVLTRATDENLSLADRAGVAKKRKAPVFVSIHFNGFDHTTQGTETFCHTTHSAISAELCRNVQKGAVGATGLKDRNKGAPGGVKTQALGVLKPSSHDNNTACVLVEVSFMDVPAEDARLNTEAYKDKVADGLASGIANYLQQNPSAAAKIAAAELEDGFEVIKSSSPAKPKKSGAKKAA